MKRYMSNWLRGMEYSILTNLLLLILASFIFSFTVFFDNHVNYYHDVIDFIAFFFVLIFYFGISTIIITLLSSCIIGTTTVYILKLLKIDKPIYAALIGSLSVYLFLLVSDQRHDWSYLFFCFFGFVCGYAFMFGYNKEEQS